MRAYVCLKVTRHKKFIPNRAYVLLMRGCIYIQACIVNSDEFGL